MLPGGSFLVRHIAWQMRVTPYDKLNFGRTNQPSGPATRMEAGFFLILVSYLSYELEDLGDQIDGILI